MNYPKMPDLRGAAERIALYAQLMHEYGATNAVEAVLAKADKDLNAALKRLSGLPGDKALARQEPNSLRAIKALRPKGPRRIWKAFDPEVYADKLEGALLGRMAGCTLGAIVEQWSVERMRNLARDSGMDLPPTNYWKRVPEPQALRYGMSKREDYTRTKMNGVPVDDDIAYTLLGLLVVEEFGPGFSIADNGKAWIKYLPIACTAEAIALRNIKNGVPATKAGDPKGNPYCEWIGADIRSDPWGYMAPAYPEFAADMAYRDAFLSHRRNGIYGEMFFAAAIAAAFAVDHPVEALEIGLTEIPKDCSLAKAVRWALKIAPQVRNYRDARAAVDEHFAGMHIVHTINNACLTIWGLTIGGTDVTRVISETVAMGMDNDCTAATAGSIAGAIAGKKGMPKHWYKNFNDTVHSYLIGHPTFTISGLVKRFTAQAQRIHER